MSKKSRFGHKQRVDDLIIEQYGNHIFVIITYKYLY